MYLRAGVDTPPVNASTRQSGNGLAPARENGPFAVAASRLSGTISAVLGWTPEQFWQATPAELVTIFAAFSGGETGHPDQAPLGTEQLEKLKETFPDG